jgi:hypothetical protein
MNEHPLNAEENYSEPGNITVDYAYYMRVIYSGLLPCYLN